MSSIWIGLTTFDRKLDALDAARRLIEQHLAACVQVEGPITSVFLWDGNYQENPEYRLVIKFPEERLAEVERCIHAQHSYQTPQWLAFPAERASEGYAAWVRDAAKG